MTKHTDRCARLTQVCAAHKQTQLCHLCVIKDAINEKHLKFCQRALLSFPRCAHILFRVHAHARQPVPELGGEEARFFHSAPGCREDHKAPQRASLFASWHLNNELLTVVFLQTLCVKGDVYIYSVCKYILFFLTKSVNNINCSPQFHIPAHTGNMKAKNRDQSLSDSRELDGSYDQLTGEWTGAQKTKRKQNTVCSACLKAGKSFYMNWKKAGPLNFRWFWTSMEENNNRNIEAFLGFDS